MSAFDVLVVGLGAMGSAATYHLARQGARVLGLDRLVPPHTQGSTHGESRIFREVSPKHPCYVPLAQRARTLWRELEAATGRTVYVETGGLVLGAPDSGMVTGARRTARACGLAIEELSAPEIRKRFPVFQPPEGTVAVHEPHAGSLSPEEGVTAHLDLARRAGADLRFDESLTRWVPDGEGVQVETDRDRYRARRLLLTAGPWLPALVADLALPLTVERQVMFWFPPAQAPERFAPDRMPIYNWEFEPGRSFYGMPELGSGCKIARHHEGESTRPDRVRRTVTPAEVADLRDLVRRYLPGLDGPPRRTAVCLYTNTPDYHFLLDFHPRHRQVLLASPCSGHGFKYASVLGAVLAGLTLHERSEFDLTPFSLARLTAPADSPDA